MKNASQKRSPGSVRILCEAAPSYNVEAKQCLEGTGLVTFDLYSDDIKVTLAQEVTAIGNFLKYAPKRAGLGIEIGRRYRPEVFGIWGYAILSSPTFRASLKTAIDYANLSFIIATVGLDEVHDPPLLTFDTSGLSPRVKSFVLERHLTVLANFSTQLLPKFSLSDLIFQTTVDDADVAAAINSMLGISVETGRPRDAIALPKALLDMPLPQHDPAVMEYCLGQCRNLMNLDDRTYPKWTAQVRETTLLEMGNDPTIGNVAAKLGVTERTLRRRLSEEGTSFRQICLEARLAIGHELLRTAGLGVSTVAWRTGYSEPSSFVRAFSKRYGYPPGSIKNDAAREKAVVRRVQ